MTERTPVVDETRPQPAEAPAQPRYLIRGRGTNRKGRHTIVQASAFRAHHPSIDRVKRVHDWSDHGLGRVREMEPTGRHRTSIIDLSPGGVDQGSSGTRVLDETGRDRAFQYGDCASVAASAEGVKSALRRLREQEAIRLDAVDAAIAATIQTLARLREGRADLVHEAWSKANVVRLAEVTEAIG